VHRAAVARAPGRGARRRHREAARPRVPLRRPNGAGEKEKAGDSGQRGGGFFHPSASEKLIGSILLGLYDGEGKLHHVGFTSSFPARERGKLLRKLKPIVRPPGFTGRPPAGPS